MFLNYILTLFKLDSYKKRQPENIKKFKVPCLYRSKTGNLY